MLDTISYPISRTLNFNWSSENGDLTCVVQFLNDRGLMGFVDELCKVYTKLREKEREFENNKVANALIIDHLTDMLGRLVFTQPSPSPHMQSEIPSDIGIIAPTSPPLADDPKETHVGHEERNTTRSSPSIQATVKSHANNVAGKKYSFQDAEGSVISLCLKYGGAKCSLDIRVVEAPSSFVSSYMKQYKMDMVKMNGLQQQVGDFLLVEEDPALEDSQIIVSYGPGHYIPREDIRIVGDDITFIYIHGNYQLQGVVCATMSIFHR